MKFVGGYSHRQQLRDEWNFKLKLEDFKELLLDVSKEDMEGHKHAIRCLETQSAVMKRCPNCQRLRFEFKSKLNRMPPSLRNKLLCYTCHIFDNNQKHGYALPSEYELWVQKSVEKQPVYEKIYESWYAEVNKGVKEETLSIEELKKFRNI